ncbi:MAG TPA: hypothetical protein VLS93_07210 [Anaeromyxobacteraceae bacterium]|nr:hypothetical protein [Anaeromyxobacteraceae bacterium]
MTSLLRMFLVASALLSSGAVQVAAAVGDDPCCPGEVEEDDAPCPDCPPGLACGCCPARGVVQASALDVAPAASPGLAIAVASAEPASGGSVTDIFHPPRG